MGWGAGLAPPQLGARGGLGEQRKRMGKAVQRLIESQGHHSDSVIPSWKESIFCV